MGLIVTVGLGLTALFLVVMFVEVTNPEQRRTSGISGAKLTIAAIALLVMAWIVMMATVERVIDGT